MKKLIIVFALCCTFSAQAQQAYLAGKITNSQQEVIFLSKHWQHQQKVQLKADGSFFAILEQDAQQQYLFGHGGLGELYLTAGDTLFLYMENSDWETLRFEGKLAAENQYLYEKVAVQDSFLNKEWYQLPWSAFQQKMELARQQFQQFAEQKGRELDISPAFAKYEREVIDYQADYFTASYPKEHEKAMGMAFENEAVAEQLRASLLEHFTQYDVLSAYHMFRGHLFRFMYDAFTSELIAPDPDVVFRGDDFTTQKLDWIDRNFADSDIRSLLYYDTMKFHIRDHMVSRSDSLMERFRNVCPTGAYREEIEALYAQRTRLQVGDTAPAFALPDLDSNIVRLEDFRDQNLYIDVWAVYCKPCLAEAPSWEKLREKYENENLAFVSISTDLERAPWVNFLKEKGWTGIHLISEGRKDSTFGKDYVIGGIPRYFLIDKDGKFIDLDAPRPSSAEIENILAGLSD